MLTPIGAEFDAEFARTGRIQQLAILRMLDNAASNCTGKTVALANAKRKPYIALHGRLQSILDKQYQEWMAKYEGHHAES